uniref:Uncharacterized protein n=1 Tax=Physcomitrium patens TaxID=3218 RepID=A0A7I4EY43_PHYPA
MRGLWWNESWGTVEPKSFCVVVVAFTALVGWVHSLLLPSEENIGRVASFNLFSLPLAEE